MVLQVEDAGQCFGAELVDALPGIGDELDGPTLARHSSRTGGTETLVGYRNLVGIQPILDGTMQKSWFK